MNKADIRQYYAIIRERLFSGFNNQDLDSFFSRVNYEIRKLEQGGYLFRERDRVTKVGILLDGELLITKGYIDGKESILDIIQPSGIFGLDVAVTHKKISTFSLLVSAPSLAIIIPFQHDEFLSRVPAKLKQTVDCNIVRYISDENIRKQRKIEIISQNGLRSRINAYFEVMAEKLGDRFAIPYSREQLADYLCVNRSALSHELSLMQREGLITYHLNEFALLPHWKRG